MPLVSLIIRKWSCGCNELTDRLLQNFSTSKHARRRNTIPPYPSLSPFSPPPFLCACTPICTVEFSSRFAANLPRATGNFPRSNGERIPRTSFHKKQFRGEIRCTSSLQCSPLAGEILFEWINLSFIGLLFVSRWWEYFASRRDLMMIKSERFLFKWQIW